MPTLFDSGIFSVVGLSSELLVGAKLYWYASGTTTPLATYSDQGLTTPNANPVVADSAGRFSTIWLQAADYKLVLKTAADVTLVTRDPIIGATALDLLALSTGSALVGYSGGIAGVSATTVQAKQREVKSLKADFGAVGDGTTDDTAAFNKAVATANAAGGSYGIFIPPGTYKVTGAVTTITADHVCFIGQSNGASIIAPTYNGAVFTFTGYGGGFEDLRVSYPSAPGANAVFMVQSGGTGQNLTNIRVNNVRTFLQIGTSAPTTGGAATITNLKGNAYNGGSPFIKLYGGAGLFINSAEVYVAGVGTPATDRTSTMTTVSGTSFIKNYGATFDTIVITGGSIIERWWRVLDFTTVAGGGLILNVIVDPTTVCDYISDDVYHLEAPTGTSAIVNVNLSGYAGSWSGRAVYVKANNNSIKDVDIINLFVPYSGYEAVRVEGQGWSYVRIKDGKFISSNRIAAGASAGIRLQDSGSGHFFISGCMTGIDGTSGGTAWQATYGISIPVDMNNFLITGNESYGATGAYDIAANNASGSGNRRVFNNINSDYYGDKTGTAPFTAPASGTPWANVSPYVVQFSASGAGVSSLQHNGTTVMLNNGMVMVQPGETAGWGGAGPATVKMFVQP